MININKLNSKKILVKHSFINNEKKINKTMIINLHFI